MHRDSTVVKEVGDGLFDTGPGGIEYRTAIDGPVSRHPAASARRPIGVGTVNAKPPATASGRGLATIFDWGEIQCHPTG